MEVDQNIIFCDQLIQSC